MKQKKKLIIEPDDTEEIEEVIPDDIIVNYYDKEDSCIGKNLHSFYILLTLFYIS